MLNAFEAAVRARPIIDQLGKLDSDHAWERVHEEFNGSHEDAHQVGLVVARWVLTRLTAPKHHKGLVAIVSVLAAIRGDEELQEVWISPQLAQVIAAL